jgi:hypothetical protein
MTPGVFLYYPGRHQVMPKLRAFIDHVKSRARNRRGRTKDLSSAQITGNDGAGEGAERAKLKKR